MRPKSFIAIPDPIEIARQAIRNNLDVSQIDPDVNRFKRSPNCLNWVAGKEFIGQIPFPRQTQIMLQFLQEYCPFCSDLDFLSDLWGRSLTEITSKVAILESGVCPICSRTKIEMSTDPGLGTQKLRHYNELVGVAGQRCLSPETKIKTPYGLRPLDDIEVGDEVIGPSGPVRIKSRVDQYHHAFFSILVQINRIKLHYYYCSDSHYWLVNRKNEIMELPTSELLVTDKLLIHNTNGIRVPVNICEIEKIYKTARLVDIEVDSKDKLFLDEHNTLLHNSGKSVLVGWIASYHLHRLLMLPIPPYAYYGLVKHNAVHMTFVALNVRQSTDTIWASFTASIDACQWFKDYFAYLDKKEHQDGIEYYKYLDTYISFRKSRIKAMFVSPRSEALRGLTRIFTAIDEWGLFPADEELQFNGNETWTSLNNSLRTIRGSAARLRAQGEICPPDGLMCNISSPMDENDPIMTQLSKCKVSPDTMFGFHYATWEMNPLQTRQSLDDEFLKNPERARRDFGAEPPVASGGFLSRVEAVDLLVEGGRKLLTSIVQQQFEVKVGEYSYQYVKPGFVPFTVSHKHAYLVTVDAGESYNSFGIMVSHWDLEIDKGVVDMVIEIEPTVTPAGEVAQVHFPSALALILGDKVTGLKGLKDCIPIWTCAYDRWQSTEHVQLIRDAGIEANVFSLKFEEFIKFRSSIYGEKWVLPEPEASERDYPNPPVSMPILRLIRQAKRVRQSGLKIIKPTSGQDDLFRCWVMANHIFSTYKHEYIQFSKSLIGFSAMNRRHRNVAYIPLTDSHISSEYANQIQNKLPFHYGIASKNLSKRQPGNLF